MTAYLSNGWRTKENEIVDNARILKKVITFSNYFNNTKHYFVSGSVSLTEKYLITTGLFACVFL